MRNTPLLWPGWWDMASTLSYEWKVMVLVSYWLPNCTHRIISGECAFTSAPQKAYWPCQYDRKAPDNTGCLRAPNMASLAWTNYSRPQLLSVWTPLLTVLPVALNWQIMLMLIFFFLFLHFAVIAVVLHGWRSTSTRSFLTADWVCRKDLALIGYLDLKTKKKQRQNAKWKQWFPVK